jgi:fumarate reductase flavoprotein subunit
MYKGGIVVNTRGERFVNEALSYKDIGVECMKQPTRLGIQVFDQRVMSQAARFPTVDDYESALAAGVLKRADSIQEIAQIMGIPPPTLQATVDTYNASAEGRGGDKLGRDCLTGGFGNYPDISVAPFYAIACTTALNTTFCGLHTDANARVLDVYGSAIAGLYATGEVMGGLHGASYLSGSSLAKACIFGRLAAQDAHRRLSSLHPTTPESS